MSGSTAKASLGVPNATIDLPSHVMVVIEGTHGAMLNVSDLVKDTTIKSLHIISPLVFESEIAIQEKGLTKLPYTCEIFPCLKPNMSMSQVPRNLSDNFKKIIELNLETNLTQLSTEQPNKESLSMIVEYNNLEYNCKIHF